MRKNHTRKQNNSISSYDHVYVEIPQCPWLADMVVEPMKCVYHNRAADSDANIVKMIRDVTDLTMFLWQNGIDLF